MASPRALLINPWVYDFACYDLFLKPLGLLGIVTMLRQSGVQVDVIDCMDRLHPRLPAPARSTTAGTGAYPAQPAAKPAVFRDVTRHYKRYGMSREIFTALLNEYSPPDIVLVTSAMTYWYQGVQEVIGIVKDRFPRVPVILGGIYATLSHAHACATSGADCVFKGADRGALALLISNYLSRTVTPGTTEPLPAYDVYRNLVYATIRSSSGCPLRCSYCAWHLMNPGVMQRPVDEVVAQIKGLYVSRGIRHFAFYDEALLYRGEAHLGVILERLQAHNVRATFHTPNGLHARFLSASLAQLLKRSGFVAPRLGFESADTRRQQSTGGKVTTAELEQAVAYLAGAGYARRDIGVYVLIGLPAQPYDEVAATLHAVHRLGVRVYLEEYSPIPGTPEYARSGLPDDADPLLHNNAAFPLYDRGRAQDFQRLKELNHRLNTCFAG